MKKDHRSKRHNLSKPELETMTNDHDLIDGRAGSMSRIDPLFCIHSPSGKSNRAMGLYLHHRRYCLVDVTAGLFTYIYTQKVGRRLCCFTT